MKWSPFILQENPSHSSNEHKSEKEMFLSLRPLNTVKSSFSFWLSVHITSFGVVYANLSYFASHMWLTADRMTSAIFSGVLNRDTA